MPEFFIPDNIDLEVLVKDIPRPDVRRNVIFGCAYVFDHFYQYPKTGKGKDIFEKTGGGVPLNMETLRSVVGERTADRAMKLLKEKGLIELKSGYVPAFNISRIYALSVSLGKPIKMNFSKKESKTAKKSKVILTPLLQNQPSPPFLQKWLTDDFLKVDQHSADFFIQFFYNRLYFEIQKVKTSYLGSRKKEYIQKLFSLLNSRFEEIVDSVSNFEKNVKSFSRSESNDRFNTVLTGMIKPVRNFLTCRDEKLYEIDITASQPFFFLILLKEVKSLKKEESEGTKSLEDSAIHLHSDAALKIDHMLCTFSGSEFVQFVDELERFSKLFQKGSCDFYENLAFELNSNSSFPISQFSNRKNTKGSFIYLLFEKFEGKNKATPAYQVFKRSFPMILKLMDTFKSEEKNKLAILLQKMEAKIVLDKIASSFSQKFPQAPIYSIHDALLTTEFYKDELNALMISILWEEAEIKPSTKMVELTPEALFSDLGKTVQKEIDLIKQKARKKKPIVGSSYQFFPLFKNEVPEWNSEKVMTISVWGQVKNNPNYKPFRVSLPNNFKSKLQTTSMVTSKPMFEEPLNNNFTSSQVLAKGYVVPPMFQFVEDDVEEREKE